MDRLCSILVLIQALFWGTTDAQRFQPIKPLRFSSSFNDDFFSDECQSPTLTCVPEDECVTRTPGNNPEGSVCPLNFVKFSDYCLFISAETKVAQRSQIQAQDFCETVNSRSFYFQSNKEWDTLERAMKAGQLNFKKDVYYWTDAYWEDKTNKRWEWRSTEEEIQWEKILKGTKCAAENQEILDQEDGCIGVKFNTQKDCMLLQVVNCLSKQIDFLCKMGIYNSRCSENSDNVCCFSESYDYYAQNILGGPGTHTSNGEVEAECWVRIQKLDKLVKCDEALDMLENVALHGRPMRVDNSYFYFARTEECIGDRRAVISSKAVNDFIVNFMLTDELAFARSRLIIGLNYDENIDRFTWDNGKLGNYYNETFWADGQPNKRAGLGLNPCVAYRKSGINAYSWHLIPTPGCRGADTTLVCEMPIRASNLVPSHEKKECGHRLERGVLAKSTYYDFEYDQAQYGEFPWQVAVVQAHNYHGGIVMIFACSGTLIHNEFVITSAHCVTSSNNDFSVSLGDWDLADEANHVLDSVLIRVADVIIHPGYKATENEKHDLALLRLESPVNTTQFPHIGLCCLPTLETFYQHSGPWECYTLGWPKQSVRERRILQRIETDLVSKRRCRHYVKSLSRHYYSHNSYFGSAEYGYDRKYGFHHLSYDQHGYFDSRHPDLFCAESFDSDSCVDDPTAMLVCRKPKIYYDDPFSSGYENEQYGGRSSRYSYADRSSRYSFADTKIINAYGMNRFDGDRWYIMGIGHALSTCSSRDKYGSQNHYGNYNRRRSSPFQLYTPVKDYLSFIHSHLDILN